MPRKPPDTWRRHARTAARNYARLKAADAALHETRITASLDAYRHGSGSPARITEAAARCGRVFPSDTTRIDQGPGRFYEDRRIPTMAKDRNEYQRQYRARNRDRLNEYKRRWSQEHPEKVAAAQARYWQRRAQEAASAELEARP